MPAKNLSDFHESLRTILGDEGSSVAGWDIPDEKLNALLRTAVKGFVPCLTINGSNPNQLVDAPIHQDTEAYLVTKAAHIMVGGTKAMAIKTRAMSVSSQPTAIRDRLHFIEYLLEEIESRGNVCSTTTANATPGLFATSEDFTTYVRSVLAECITSLPTPDCDLVCD